MADTAAASTNRVFELIQAAKAFESQGNWLDGATKYYEAVYLMRHLVTDTLVTPEQRQQRQLLLEQIQHYDQCASRLMTRAMSDDDDDGNNMPVALATPITEVPPPIRGSHSSSSSSISTGSGDQQQPEFRVEVPLRHSSLWKLRKSARQQAANQVGEVVGRASANLARALDLDESLSSSSSHSNCINSQLAVQAYTEAAQGYLESLRLVEEKKRTVANKKWDGLVEALRRRLEITLERAEHLKRTSAAANGDLVIGSTPRQEGDDRAIYQQDIHNQR